MNILLIGGNGFIGSRLLPHLIEANNRVTIASRNPLPAQLKITPGEALDIKQNQFDLIINAAGKYGKKNIQEEMDLTIEANIGVCKSISQSISLISKGVINLSSYFEIVSAESPIREIYYTKSKVSGNNLLQNACDVNKKFYSRIILFDNYDKDISRGKILDQLLQSVITGKSITIKNIETTLNLLSTEQVIDAIVRVTESYKTAKPFSGRIDIKNHINYKISDLIKIIESTSGRKIHFINLNQSLDTELQKVVLDEIDHEININLSDKLPSYIEKMLKLSL